jgi:hypothetical protein
MIRKYSALNDIYDQIEAKINDKEFLKGYDLRDMAICDWITGIETAVEEMEIEIAKNMLGKGISINLIYETTALDIETIQLLQFSR